VREADTLADWLSTRPSADDATVTGWRFELVEGAGVRVGVRQSELGGAYEGPGVALRLGGSLEITWSDGQRSSANLDRRAILAPHSGLPAWRASAYAERGGRLPPLAGPVVLPAVETEDPAVAAAVEDDPTVLLRLLNRLRREALDAGLRRVDGVLRASRGRRSVRTSRGFAAEWSETTCTVDVWGDEVAHASYGRRAMPNDADLDRLVREVTTLAPLLRVQESVPSSARGAIFAPSVVDELLDRLLLPNLGGRAIRDGRSPFTRADLDAARPIIRADLDLVIDTTLPLELATAPCSPDGIPAGQVALIAGGRLTSPVLDLATASELGRPPTPAPRGRPTALLVSQEAHLTFDEAVAMLGEGVVIRDLPGLHTQQVRRSRYALVAPDAQVVSQGTLGGRCAARVAGNLLDQLTQQTTRLIRATGELGVGLLVLTGVDLLPA
jgi:predicted Zn-dependent protease